MNTEHRIRVVSNAGMLIASHRLTHRIHSIDYGLGQQDYEVGIASAPDANFLGGPGRPLSATADEARLPSSLASHLLAF